MEGYTDTDRWKDTQTQTGGRIHRHRQMEGYTDTERLKDDIQIRWKDTQTQIVGRIYRHR